MSEIKIFSPEKGLITNPDDVYTDLARREYRDKYTDGADGIVRSGFAREKRPIDVRIDSEDEIVIPISEHGNMMSPVEASTGVPLPIISAATSRGGGGPNDYHHAFFYDLTYSKHIDQRAVRYSRLQRVPQWAHSRYHQHFDGTAYPKDHHEAFKMVMLSCAGYVPEFGVYAKKKELVIRQLNSNERYALRQPDSFMTERYENGRGIQRRSIGQFIMTYALSQNFDAFRMREVREFLELTPQEIEKSPEFMQSKLEERKRQLARRLTNMAISSSLDAIRPDFMRAKERSLLRRDDSVGDPWIVAKAQLSEKEPDYYKTLEGVLSAHYNAVA